MTIIKTCLCRRRSSTFYNSGTVHIDVQSQREKIKAFVFADKHNKEFQPGLEIADLVCLPLNRVRRGLYDVSPRHVEYGQENKIFKAIKGKIYTPTGIEDMRNWGFKKVPIVKRTRPWVDLPDTPAVNDTETPPKE
ncbi:hypothetical protein ACFO8Q_07580 [Effusibacillus consociatus]|uniref:Uncharacterized protein n=1 Tax=Effusibacillus consociatus TaxID=1117041 RepID=A0ABV9PY66_9BACL